MFKLQYFLLILTFSRVYKNQKRHYQNYWGHLPPLPSLPPPPSGDGPVRSEILENKNGLPAEIRIQKREKVIQACYIHKQL